MPTFLIVSPHTGKDCSRVIQDTLATGYLTHFDWGCKDGEHTGWAVLEADNKAEALMAVPPLVRSQARAILLTKFSPDEVRGWHDAKK